jgi:hypothetical protein
LFNGVWCSGLGQRQMVGHELGLDGLGRYVAGGVQESGQGGVGAICCPCDLECELMADDGDEPDTSAAPMARPDTPMMSLATTPS